MEKKMKFCIHCKHYDGLSEIILPVCKKSSVTNMVDGQPILRTCSETRQTDSLCGKDATWFEPKKNEPPP